MNSLSTELKGVIGRRLERASSGEILAIASALCVDEAPTPTANRIPYIQPRFEVIGDGDQVRDNSTDLIWSRGNVGGGRLSWKDAEQACRDCKLGGFSDWRLPTIKELLSLVDYERHNPAIDVDAFKCESAWYWSATSYAGSPSGYAWGVYFHYGYAYCFLRYSLGFVRAVRVGQF